MTLSKAQAVGHVLAAADQPLTVDEILVRTELLRPLESAQRRAAEARRVCALMLRLNPNDNQGARFLLAGLDRGRSWQAEAAWAEQAWGKPA